MPESDFTQLHINKACWEIWLFDDQPHSYHNWQWQTTVYGGSPVSFPTKPRGGIRKLEHVCNKTNYGLCWIPGHAIQAPTGFVRYILSSADLNLYIQGMHYSFIYE